tara:strand:- start:192 stop:494 length:303 start_codon:yes stop_codon:yes gene_type:complete
MIATLGIEDPFDEDLESPKVCRNCFDNRDTVLNKTVMVIKKQKRIECSELLNTNEIKMIYYSLFYDNSGVDNSSISEIMPSYSSYDTFKLYLKAKFGIVS